MIDIQPANSKLQTCSSLAQSCRVTATETELCVAVIRYSYSWSCVHVFQMFSRTRRLAQASAQLYS